jgi:hypothetical protein
MKISGKLEPFFGIAVPKDGSGRGKKQIFRV